MPLEQSGSNEARQHNIETEIHAGKPIKQSIAIGYAVQRREHGHVRHEPHDSKSHDHHKGY